MAIGKRRHHNGGQRVRGKKITTGNLDQWTRLENALQHAERERDTKSQNGPVRVLWANGKPVNQDQGA